MPSLSNWLSQGHQCVFQYGRCESVRTMFGDDRGCGWKVRPTRRRSRQRRGVLNQKITEITSRLSPVVKSICSGGAHLQARDPGHGKQRRGCICFTTSVAADIGFPEHAVYGAARKRLWWR